MFLFESCSNLHAFNYGKVGFQNIFRRDPVLRQKGIKLLKRGVSQSKTADILGV